MIVNAIYTRLLLGNDNLRAPDSSPWWSFVCYKPGTSHDDWNDWDDRASRWIRSMSSSVFQMEWTSSDKPKYAIFFKQNLISLKKNEHVWNMAVVLVILGKCACHDMFRPRPGPAECGWHSSLHLRFLQFSLKVWVSNYCKRKCTTASTCKWVFNFVQGTWPGASPSDISVA